LTKIRKRNKKELVALEIKDGLQKIKLLKGEEKMRFLDRMKASMQRIH